METEALNKADDQIIAKIHALDLAPIKFKLMDKDEGYGWSREQADQIETEYKRFLILLVKYPNESIAPSKEVDKFWHGHILDTLKYAEDCDQVFGYFLHHFPYFGMRGSEDAANLAAAAVTMNRLYRQEFGDVKPAQAGSYCGATRAESYCGAVSDVSYCGAAADEEAQFATTHSSYCGAARDQKVQLVANQSSYCGATRDKEPQLDAVQSSYCGADRAKEPQLAANQSSYCGAARDISYCGAADFGAADNDRSPASILNTAMRPTLPH